jgi:hypothetical protein
MGAVFLVRLATVLVVVIAAIGDYRVSAASSWRAPGQPTCGAAPPAIRIAMATNEKADDRGHLP